MERQTNRQNTKQIINIWRRTILKIKNEATLIDTIERKIAANNESKNSSEQSDLATTLCINMPPLPTTTPSTYIIKFCGIKSNAWQNDLAMPNLDNKINLYFNRF